MNSSQRSSSQDRWPRPCPEFTPSKAVHAQVNQESSALAGCVCFFANYGKKDSSEEEEEEERKTQLQGIVKRLGGSTAQFDVAGVTHFLAGEGRLGRWCLRVWLVDLL